MSRRMIFTRLIGLKMEIMRVPALLFCIAILVACGGGGDSESTTTPASGADNPPQNDVAPTVQIVLPTGQGNYTSSQSSLTLSGTASDDTGVVMVGWSNNLGGKGTQSISGSQVSWRFDGVPLAEGLNRITVTAWDTAGQSSTALLSVTRITGSQSTIGGRVDSSLINRYGINAIYIYSGSVTPDDLGGAGNTPYAIAPVTQETGGCLWSYRSDVLPPGPYTIAFTGQAAQDNPLTDDVIAFVGVASVTISGTSILTHDYSAPRILRVGSGRQFARPSEAIASALDGDVIEIDAGTYVADVASWRQNNLTLRGVGGFAHLKANGAHSGGKAIWVIKGNNTLVENIEFSGATVPDENGAGIRQEGNNLIVCRGYFHDNENGILGGGGDILVEYSEFAYNGFGDGQSHNMYIIDTNRFTLRYSYSHHAKIGHNVKSRAIENHILYNRIMDEKDGTSSYAIDLPDAGLSYIIGNLIQQGPGTDNSTIISYGAEGGLNPVKELYIVNNTIVNNLGSGTAVYVRSGTTARIINNIFSGNGKILSGPGTLTTNLITNTPGLVDSDGFDYRLTAASPARDAGSDPGTVNGFSLMPVSQYVHRAGQEARTPLGNVDIGAYEFSP